MMNAGVLEQPGKWRWLLIIATFVIILIPTLPMLWSALSESSTNALDLGGPFGQSLLRSLWLAAVVAVVSAAIGLHAGALTALYKFPGRRILILLTAIPLIVPSFLMAIGISILRSHLGLSSAGLLSGWIGTAMAFCTQTIPLVFFVTFVSTWSLAKSQVESIRLMAGERSVFRSSIKAAFPIAALTGVLAGMITLADPGPGQILGFSGVPYEVLLSFSALYDFPLAAKQCAVLSLVVLLFSVPLLGYLGPKVAVDLLARDIRSNASKPNRSAGASGFLFLALVVTSCFALPVVGLVMPLFNADAIPRGTEEVWRTLPNTLLYAITAALLATLLGYLFATAIGRDGFRRQIACAGLILVFSLPPSLITLGLIKLGAIAPSWMDFLFRSRFSVGMALGMRFTPIASIFAIRAIGATSPTQNFAASVHGVSLITYFRRVLGPALLPGAAVCAMIVALLASAEVGVVLLLRPPGADSLPVQIFTVMANAPESLVAALCFIYISLATALVMLTPWIWNRARAT
jgi:iron(III) transport system permease protein